MGRIAEKVVNRATLRLLLIEDSDIDAFMAQKFIFNSMKDVECLRAVTLKAGEEVLSRGETDVLLLDLGLPDTETPVDTYEQIKKWVNKLPVIIMTNLKDHDLARVMVHEGAADFLNKDDLHVNPRLLQDAIDFSVERHLLSRSLMLENEKVSQESKQKDSVLNCFMGGYSINNDAE